MKFVLLNGPPHCGKDTAVSHLVPYLEFKHLKYAAPLKRMAAALLQCDMRWIEENKDTFIMPFGYNYKITLRQFLIDLSEKFFKPLYGEEVFANLLWDEAKQSASKLFLVSDCGFVLENERTARNAGSINCLLIRIHRNNCNFTNDSRSYINIPSVKTLDIPNNLTRHDLTMRVLSAIIRQWPGEVEPLKEPDWIK